MKKYSLFNRIRPVYILTALLSVSHLSCSKFLEVEPKEYVSDETTIVDKSSAETALNGAYRNLADNNYYARTFQFIIYLQGGELGWGDSRTVNLQFIQRNVRADNEEVSNVWRAIYKTINQANTIIEKLPAVSDPALPQSLKNKISGEAHFIRALSYFDLVRTWGGVQIVLTPTKAIADKLGIPRSTADQTYAQVLSDLNAAENLLSEVSTTVRNRATLKTVWALKARYHLYKKEWGSAETYAGKLISDTDNYRLVGPYNSWFANNVIGTVESVLETSYSANIPNTHRNSWQPPANGGIRSWFPLDEFVALIRNPEIGGNRNTLVATTPGLLNYGNLYYRNPAVDPSYIIRIAELYLIRAEARARLGNYEGSRADLNAVRNRAALQSSYANTEESLLLAIENERRFEFAFEPHRWYDLVRTGRIAAVLNATDPNKYVLPIPITQISIDPALQQNSGY